MTTTARKFWRDLCRALARSSPAFTGGGRRLADEDRAESYNHGFADGRLAERVEAGELPEAVADDHRIMGE